MYNKDILYFIFGTTAIGTDNIEFLFENGLFNVNNSIITSLMYVDKDDDELKDYIKNLGYDAVFIVRIPKIYLMPKNNNNTLTQIPLPIWKKINNVYYITPELIHSVYLKDIDKFIENSKYRELHNPTGLIFDRKQEDLFRDNNITKWYKYAQFRKEHDYKELCEIDNKKRIWDNALNQYQNYYKKRIRK